VFLPLIAFCDKSFVNGAGIQHNGSAFGAPTAPDGVQTAFLQTTSNIYQTVNFTSSGNFTVNFYAAARAGYTGGSFNVVVDSTNVGSFTPSSTSSFTSYVSSSISLSAGNHTINFNGTGTGDCFIDNVTISAVSGDSQAPTVPTNLASPSKTNTTVNLTWTASTDNVGVTGYKIYRNGTQIGTSATNSYTDTGLTKNTQYSYTVSAYDAAGNNSAQCSAIQVTTTNVTAPTLGNASFETPSTSTFQMGPMTYSWIFNAGGGVEHNGGPFGASNAPDGVQAALIQSGGYFSQAVTFAAGTYKVNFQAAKRTTFGGTQSFNVLYDSTVIGSYTPSSGSFTAFSTNTFTATAGSHTIKFLGTTSDDNTDFFDLVSISAI
jgi:hypothetical protein